MNKKNQSSALSLQVPTILVIAISAVLVIVALLLWLALYSYSPADPAWRHNNGVVTHNSLGFLGAWYADLSFSLIGKLSYLVPISLLAFALHLWREKDFDIEIFSWRLFMVLTAILSGCVLWTKHSLEAINTISLTGGGAVGAWLVVGLEKSVQSVTMIMAFSLVIFVISISLLLDFPWVKLADFIGGAITTFFAKLTGKSVADTNNLVDDEQLPKRSSLQEKIRSLNSAIKNKKSAEDNDVDINIGSTIRTGVDSDVSNREPDFIGQYSDDDSNNSNSDDDLIRENSAVVGSVVNGIARNTNATELPTPASEPVSPQSDVVRSESVENFINTLSRNKKTKNNINNVVESEPTSHATHTETSSVTSNVREDNSDHLVATEYLDMSLIDKAPEVVKEPELQTEEPHFFDLDVSSQNSSLDTQSKKHAEDYKEKAYTGFSWSKNNGSQIEKESLSEDELLTIPEAKPKRTLREKLEGVNTTLPPIVPKTANVQITSSQPQLQPQSPSQQVEQPKPEAIPVMPPVEPMPVSVPTETDAVAQVQSAPEVMFASETVEVEEAVEKTEGADNTPLVDTQGTSTIDTIDEVEVVRASGQINFDKIKQLKAERVTETVVIQGGMPVQPTEEQVTPQTVVEPVVEPTIAPVATAVATTATIGKAYDKNAEMVSVSKQQSQGDYITPSVDLLDTPPAQQNAYTEDDLAEMAGVLESTLSQFNINATVMNVSPGPVITRFELELAPGIQARKVTNLSNDLARALAVSLVRVEEVIPGSSYVGLEVPNKQRQTVYFKDIVCSKAFQESKSPLTISLGSDTSGKPQVVDLMKMPHALVAGTTGSGKSVCINSMLLSMLFKSSPKDLRLILVDPKMLEMSMYEDIPHLLTPVITDMNEAENALTWAVGEMERRYQLMAALKVRKIDAFNEHVEEAIANGEPIKDPLWEPDEQVGYTHHPTLERLPFIVIVIDELADMMMVVGKQVEQLIARLTQKARAAGIHVVLATQRPSTDVLTGLIKANVPTRLAFQVSSGIDSKVILDCMGAEKLLGHGDMLYVPPGASHPQRYHGAFVGDAETDRITDYLRSQGEPNYIDGITKKQDPESLGAFGAAEAAEAKEDADPLYEDAVNVVLETQKASISSVQRHLRIGYNRAARMIEDMQEQGIVSEPVNGTRKVIGGK